MYDSGKLNTDTDSFIFWYASVIWSELVSTFGHIVFTSYATETRIGSMILILSIQNEK